MLWVGEVHLSEIISSVELYCFNIGGGLFSEWEKYTPILKQYSSTLDMISLRYTFPTR
jgi:hypothetical protein